MSNPKGRLLDACTTNPSVMASFADGPKDKSLQWSDLREGGHEGYARMARPRGETSRGGASARPPIDTTAMLPHSATTTPVAGLPMRLLAAALALLSTPAFADAVTYSGTLGGREIVVELTEPADGVVTGRYAILADGYDIPLQPRTAENGAWVLAEEAPCGDDDCPADDDGLVADPPIAAIWTLTLSDDGTSLIGTRRSEGAKAKSQPVALEAVARRALEEEPTPYFMHDRAMLLGFEADRPLNAQTAPYDMLRLSGGPLETGPIEPGEAGAFYGYTADPRTGFFFPSVLALPGNTTTAINEALHNHRNRMAIDALSCKSLVYAGFGRTNNNGFGGGTLGGYEDETVTVTYLSPTVMSWTETGSLYCTGAHPYNHANNYNYDVKSGQPLDLSRIFSGWVARPFVAEPGETADLETARAHPDDYVWGPDDALIAWVRAHRQPPTDAQWERECGIDDLIAEYLDMRFERGDRVTFALSGLPHVMSACAGDLVTVPLSDMVELLTPEAGRFFPGLAAN